MDKVRGCLDICRYFRPAFPTSGESSSGAKAVGKVGNSPRMEDAAASGEVEGRGRARVLIFMTVLVDAANVRKVATRSRRLAAVPTIKKGKV